MTASSVSDSSSSSSSTETGSAAPAKPEVSVDDSTSNTESQNTASQPVNITYTAAVTASPPIQLAHSPARGHHYVAVRAITAGECILHSQPIQSQPFQALAEMAVPHSTIQELALVLLQHPDNVQYQSLAYSTSRTSPYLPASDARHGYSEQQWQVAISKIQNNAATSQYVKPSDESGKQADHSDSKTLEDSERLYVLELHTAISPFNHSCIPNCAVYESNDSTDASVYALEDISAGTECCICYRSTLLYLPTAIRRQQIEATWRFDCECMRCKGESAEMKRIERLIKSNAREEPFSNTQNKKLEHSVAQLTQRMEREDASPPDIIQLRADIERWFKTSETHVAHYVRHQLRSAVLPALLNQLNEWQLQLKYQQRQAESSAVQKQWTLRAYSYLNELLQSNALVMPALHPYKLQATNTFVAVSAMMGISRSAAEKHIQRIDPHYERVTQMYNTGKDG